MVVAGDRCQSASTRSEWVKTKKSKERKEKTKKKTRKRKEKSKKRKEKRRRKQSCALTTAALLTLQLLLRLEGLAQTLQVEHPTALTLTGHQLLTGLLTHLQPDRTS